MSISTPEVMLALAQGRTFAANFSYPYTLTAGAPAGARVWVLWGPDGADSTPADPVVTTTDSKGNTWETFQPVVRGGTVSAAYGATSLLTTALVAGDTITLTNGDGWGVVRDSILIAYSTDVGTMDQGPLTASLTTSALSIGPTGATDTDEEIAWAFWGSGPRTFTMTNGYTKLAEIPTVVGSSERQLTVAYRILAATGAQTVTATMNSATTSIGSLSTWRGTAPPPPADTGAWIHNGTMWVPATRTLL